MHNATDHSLMEYKLFNIKAPDLEYYLFKIKVADLE